MHMIEVLYNGIMGLNIKFGVMTMIRTIPFPTHMRLLSHYVNGSLFGNDPSVRKSLSIPPDDKRLNI